MPRALTPIAPVLLGLAAAATFAPFALAAGSVHTTLASFQQNIRADAVLEQFSGTPQNFFDPYVVAAGGYAFSVQSSSGVRRDELGIGGLFDGDSTEFMFTGRPVSAFAGTFRVRDENLTPINGSIIITLSTGEAFTVPIGINAGAGTFVGITSTRPFTSLIIDSPRHSPPSSLASFEWIDDVSVGTSASAVVFTDQCADAVTITPITAAQYPFSTADPAASATAIPGSCALIPGLDTGADVWVRLVAPISSRFTISTCGATFDTVLRIFDDCGPAGTGVGGAQIACNDDACAAATGGNTASLVQFHADAGEDYLVRISGYSGATGTGTLSVSVVPDCAADFNHSGGASVQDIFDFLNAYFIGCP